MRSLVVAYLGREGPLNYDEAFGLLQREKDAVIWRFARAWKDKDAQGITNILNFHKDVSGYILKGGTQGRIEAWMLENTGSGKMFSDHMHAMTRGRVHSDWKHPDDYYKTSPSARWAEIFANVTSVAGESAFGAKMVKHFTPATYREYLKGVKGMRKAGIAREKQGMTHLEPALPPD